MAGYFLDTSALAKPYHEEPGSDYIESILNQPGSKGIVSRLSLWSGWNPCLQSRSEPVRCDENGRSLALRRLRADIARDRLIVGPPIEPKHYRAAAKMLRLHGVSRRLRTLDALQLAVALDMLEASWISAMLSADKRLCEVAEVCGCPAIDPAKPGLVQG